MAVEIAGTSLNQYGGGSALCGLRPGPGVQEPGLWNPESWLLAPLVHSPRGPQINI